MKLKQNVINIFCDGSCKPNPGNGGIGIVWIYKDKRKELSESIGKSTNNIAELSAVKTSLHKLKIKSIPIRIYTDSQYSIGVLSQNWKAEKNKELIEEIKNIINEFDDVKFIKVKGHKNNYYNNKADKLAKQGIDNNV